MKSNNCRVCSSSDFTEILDYGNVALADGFLDGAQNINSEKTYPLHLVICQECRHVQIQEVLDPEILFKHYVYKTGTSASVQHYAHTFVNDVLLRIPEGLKTPRVLEIASNDGTVLSCFRQVNCEVFGIDPAKNITKLANAKGINTLSAFFSKDIALNICKETGKWDIIVARNVLAHVKDLHSVIDGTRLLLNGDGFCVIEVPHLETMYRELQYDQVFHEHIGYHSLDSIVRLIRGKGLEVFDVEKTWIHGGSIRVFLQHIGAGRPVSTNVRKVLNQELDTGLLEIKSWKSFGTQVIRHRQLLREEIIKLRKAGSKIAVYGASGKGQSMLQFVGLDHNQIAYVVDKSEMKQGKLTPGTHIEIFPPTHIHKDFPDVILLCAWNFSEEIVVQEKEFIKLGGRFLHPLPEPHYLS